ncbi:unnamed protein product [Rotaria sp. Silwood1]|nr:unnamed protein product [Rotaria sp. Silwood1]
MFVNEERLHINGLVILAEEEVDKVILAHYGAKFGCGTRALHYHLTEVCDHLELIFCEHGTPTIIQTDQGTEFQGLFDELCLKRNIKHIRSRAYHPESQGKVERLNRSWKNKMFFDVLINGNTNWAASLPSYSQTYNTSKHRGLGNLTPFFVYFGREAVITTSSSMNIDEEEIEQLLWVRMYFKDICMRDATALLQPLEQWFYELLCFLDHVMVKLSGKKFDLYKRKNIICPGIVMQTKEADFLYLVQYEYSDRIREDWFFVDNITCRTVQEQEQRLESAAKRTRKENSMLKNTVKKLKTEHHEFSPNGSKKELMQNVYCDLGEHSFEIPFFYPETADVLRERQEKEKLKNCIFCVPAVPNNGGCVVQGNLTLIFLATCTLDYFLSFIRLAFLKNNHLQNFLKASTQTNIVAETLLEMEPLLRALDWNMARFIWAKMIGVVDRALDEQHRSAAVFKQLKNKMENELYEWQMAEHRCIEEKMIADIYVNCFGSEDEFFANHLANLVQNVLNGQLQDPVVAQYDTRYPETCGVELVKWSTSTPVPKHAELKYVKIIKIMEDNNNSDESGLYVVCAGERSFGTPAFLYSTYPPLLMISNVDPAITTSNVPHHIYVKQQK